MDQPAGDTSAKPLKRPAPGKPCRRFGLLDAMILVVAIAAGAASVRLSLPHWSERPDLFKEFYPALGPFSYAAYADSVVKFLGPWLASWTLAFLAIRLRTPRPRFR